MRLCLRCGRVGKHEPGCADDAEVTALDVTAKHERVLAGMQALAPALAEAEAAVANDPRAVVQRCWELEKELERYPATDLQAFDARRSHNDLATKLSKLRSRAAEALGAEAATRVVE